MQDLTQDLMIFLSRSLLSWLAIQICFTLVFLWYLRSHRQESLSDSELPKTAVILCLRGADPSLPQCLQALLTQNYPEYDLKLILDSQEDPALKIITEMIAELGATNVQISPLRIVRHNCSLKCSSLVQAVSDLDDSYKAVALVDADIIVHPNWLRELVSPLVDAQVGATTGNRWYIPTGSYWGSLLRYVGNVTAVVQMFSFKVPWGGTLAMRTEVIHQTELLDKWGQSLSDDVIIHNILKKHGLYIKFVPSLLMMNREETDLLSLLENLQRLILCFRLYHPFWLALVGDMISSILFPNLVIILILELLLETQWYAAFLLFSCYSAYTIGLLLLMLSLEQAVQQVIYFQGQSITKLSASIILKMLIAIPLTQWVYGIAILSSLWMSTVQWRGLTYRVQGHGKIRLVEYRHYQWLDQPVDSKLSL